MPTSSSRNLSCPHKSANKAHDLRIRKGLLTWKGNWCVLLSAAFEGLDELQKYLWQDLSENQQTLTQINSRNKKAEEQSYSSNSLHTTHKQIEKENFQAKTTKVKYWKTQKFLEANTEITQCQASHCTTWNALAGKDHIQRETLQGRGVRREKLTTSAIPHLLTTPKF